MLPLAAFVGGAGVTLLVYRLARCGSRVDVVTLLLAGIACNAVVGALIGLCTFLADEAQLRSLTFWSMGSLGNAGWRVLPIPTGLMLAGCLLLLREARALDALLLGERDAAYLGYRVEACKRRCIVLAALVVGAAVCLTGGIGFVGLVVPHLCRLALGPRHRRLLPVAAAGGAVLLILADAVARSVVAPAELPIGILTASIGGPVFLAMLVRQRARWSGA